MESAPHALLAVELRARAVDLLQAASDALQRAAELHEEAANILDALSVWSDNSEDSSSTN